MRHDRVVPRRRPIVAALLAAAVCASCGVSAEDGQKPAVSAVPPRKPIPVPSSAPPSGKLVTAEVPPDLIEKMRADLAQHAGIAASAAKVVRAESIVWPSGALGCPTPGEMYTQSTVAGYVVELAYGGRTYAYHATKQGFFKLCPPGTAAVGAAPVQ